MSFSKKPYRIVPLARCVLAKLYVEHVNDSSDAPLSLSQIADLFSIEVSKNLLLSALAELNGPTYSQNKLIGRSGNRSEGYSYQITVDGLRVVERSLRDKSSDISYFIANGDTALDDVAGLDGIFWTRDELEEEGEWEHISLNSDDSQVIETTDVVEKAIEEIERNNELEAKYPDQKRGIVKALHNGLATLKSLLVTRAELRALLIRPLKWIATTFANTFIGQIAKSAAQKVVDLLLSILT